MVPLLDPRRRVLFGISLVCFANLLLEVVLTRIFSAMMYYHFTFLAISLALLGLGASGVYVYVHSDRFAEGAVEEHLARYARAFAWATVLALAYVVANPVAESTEGAGNVRLSNYVVLRLVLLILVTVLPFFYAGIVVSLAIATYRRAVNRVYAFDLGGAACAAVLAGLLLRALGGPSAVVLVAVAASGASALFAGAGRRRFLPLLGSALLLLASVTTPLFALPPIKAEAGRLLFEAWNAFSRVTVVALRTGALEIQMDAAAATRVSSLESVPPRQESVSALGLVLYEGASPDVLVIGPGGGLDVAHALQAGARRVTAVDINPLITHAVMSQRFVAESGGLYQDPRVDLVTAEGRSFVRRSRERYDLIQATLIDTWAATSAGAFALTENNLYTIEAFDDYFDHLTPRGVLAFCRYYRGDPETVRLIVLAAAALERRGVPAGRSRDHLYVAYKRGLAITLAKSTAFTPAELDRLDGASQAGGFTLVLSPRTSGQSEVERLVDGGANGEAVRSYPLDITPPTDDRPFFFYFGRARDLLDLGGHLSSARLRNPALWVLSAVAFTVTILVVVFVFVPLGMYRLSDLHAHGRDAHLRHGLGLVYFALIGLAFMVVEIGLMQKLVLFLGHPTYAFITVVSAMLVGGSTGALLAQRWSVANAGRLVLRAGAALTVAVVVAAFASGALRSAIAWPLGARIATAFLVAFALGLMMGVMLPTGVRILSLRDAPLVPWAWGVNGGMSVIATVAATVAAIHFGFTPTLLGGAILYALAGICGWRAAALAAASPADLSGDGAEPVESSGPARLG
jgi:hypothetical protein